MISIQGADLPFNASESSKTAAAPNISIKIFIAFIIQLIKSLDKSPPTDFITTEKGPMI